MHCSFTRKLRLYQLRLYLVMVKFRIGTWLSINLGIMNIYNVQLRKLWKAVKYCNDHLSHNSNSSSFQSFFSTTPVSGCNVTFNRWPECMLTPPAVTISPATAIKICLMSRFNNLNSTCFTYHLSLSFLQLLVFSFNY